MRREKSPSRFSPALTDRDGRCYVPFMVAGKEDFGRPLAFPLFRGCVHPEWDRPFFLRMLAESPGLFDDPAAKMLHSGRNRIIEASVEVEGKGLQRVAVKEFKARGVNLMKTMFLPPKARRAWKGGTALLRRKIPTPFPLAYLEEKRSPFIRRGYYWTLLLDGAEEVRTLFRSLPPGELGGLVRALARHLARCHRLGILHRDLSDGNVMAAKRRDASFDFFLLDTNRIRIRKRVGVLGRIKSLVRLGIPPALQRDFLQEYLGGNSPRRWQWWWYRACKRTYAGTINLKKRFRLKKAAEKLGVQ